MGCLLRAGQSAATAGAVCLEWSRDESTLSAVRQRAEVAAAAAAVSNADSGQASQYNRTSSSGNSSGSLPVAKVILASAARIPKVRAHLNRLLHFSFLNAMLIP